MTRIFRALGTCCSVAVAAVFLLAATSCSSASAQTSPGRATAAPASACQLLSGAEIRKITGRQDYDNGDEGDAPGQGIGGGSSCQFTGAKFTDNPPGIGVVLIPLKAGKSMTDAGVKPPPNCTHEPVPGVGGAAYFESCQKGNPQIVFKAGAHDVIVIMEVDPPATLASTRTTMIGIAKTAAAKLQ